MRNRTFLLLAGFALLAALFHSPVLTSSASFTSRTVNPGGTVAAAPDWVPPRVTMGPVDPVLRGTVTLTAQADDPGGTGVRDVRFDHTTPAGWTPTGTATTAPYAAAFDTRTVPDGPIQLRATATDHAGYEASTAPVASTVDNRPVRGHDVQARNGGTLGRFDRGDVLELTYTHLLQPATIVPGWNGTARPVVVRVLPRFLASDLLDVFTDRSLAHQIPVGYVDLDASYVDLLGGATLHEATMAAAPTVVDGRPATTIRIVVGNRLQGRNTLLPVLTSSTMVWYPTAGPVDTFGIGIDPALVTEGGSRDRDF